MKSKFIFAVSLGVFFIITLACQSAEPIYNLFATPTPTNTVTPSPTPSPVPTITPTPLPIEVQIEQQSDGSVRIVDYQHGYIFELSKDWFPVPADPQSLKDAASELSETNPEAEQMIDSMDAINDESFRLMAINQKSGLRDRSFVANLMALALKDEAFKYMPVSFFVEMSVEQVKESGPIIKIISSDVATNQHNIEYGIIEVETGLEVDGRTVKAFQSIINFKSGSSMIIMTVSLSDSKKEFSAELVEEIVESIQLLEVK